MQIYCYCRSLTMRMAAVAVVLRLAMAGFGKTVHSINGKEELLLRGIQNHK